MSNLITRIQTLLTSVVTWLSVAMVVLTIVAQELADYADNEAVANVLRYVASALIVIGVTVAIVRRVTPVIRADRGLLPIANPTPEASVLDGTIPRDRGQSAVITTVVIAVLAVLAVLYILGR